MRHKWDDGEWLLDVIVSQCSVCGGFRTRSRYEGIDYHNASGISIDMVGKTRKGWRYSDTPRSCPGEPLRKEGSDSNVQSD